MSAGLSRLLRGKPGASASPAERRRDVSHIPLGSALIGLAVLAILICGALGWLAMSMDEGETTDASLAQLTSTNSSSQYGSDEDGTEPSRGFPSVVPGMAEQSNAVIDAASSSSGGPGSNLMDANASLTPTQPPAPSTALDPAVLSGLRISSQSWRRGGLGSKALVTFTLRNANKFAIKDVEISCAFSRRDGSHVTDRRRLVPGEIASRSRKTFAAVHVGFVNVNVSTAKCALVAATKI
ncbi:hypothetical protein [Bradyrhizobium oligotrophicum]|nr:hypothetical protein [Bradyrhizobium oligotrophicum]